MSVPDKAKRVLTSLLTPEWRRGLRYGVAPIRHHSRLPLRSDYRTVIDVGANRGQFALFARHLAPRSTIVCFEPLEAPRSVLTRLFRGDPAVIIEGSAMGNMTGRASMHVSRDDDSSSLLPPSQLQLRRFGAGAAETGLQQVAVTTLDSHFQEAPDEPILLKLDVQGYELEVLQGGTRLLRSVATVVVECSFQPFYSGQPLFADVHDWLRVHEFELIGGFLSSVSRGGRWEQGDFVYARLLPPTG